MGEADVIFEIRINRENKGLTITQSYYIEKILKKIKCDGCGPGQRGDAVINRQGDEIQTVGQGHILNGMSDAYNVSSELSLLRISCKPRHIASPLNYPNDDEVQKVVYVLSTPMSKLVKEETLEQTRRRCRWDNDDYLCRGHIFNGMSDALFDEKDIQKESQKRPNQARDGKDKVKSKP
ncbi:hypothetical protein Tco_1232583, partial [Tanacetum coccineum]